MIFNTYGSIDNPHIMLIHGAGYGWWNFINYIDTLSKSLTDMKPYMYHIYYKVFLFSRQEYILYTFVFGY